MQQKAAHIPRRVMMADEKDIRSDPSLGGILLLSALPVCGKREEAR